MVMWEQILLLSVLKRSLVYPGENGCHCLEDETSDAEVFNSMAMSCTYFLEGTNTSTVYEPSVEPSTLSRNAVVFNSKFKLRKFGAGGRRRRRCDEWISVAKEALNQISTVARFLCLLHVTDKYLCSPTLAYGPSMLPTLNLTGDVILSEQVSYRLGRVGPGDIVLVRSPTDPLKIVTKRILGLEGDRVTFYDPLSGDICRTVVVFKKGRVIFLVTRFQRGHVWIQGDNIYASNDSRYFGPVPYGLIQGKAFFRVWPPDSFGRLGP
ncbi:hypothetical protein Patl1_04980 [Pistacia atlantica]|uniref:Uncharacterized protein n=1 Tax=Pistacia atlantica TaxID=434234 RepID=A0ACC1BPF0_9ROSI|nr:hypothetical protein Patl1_04980 [Pistacia atlantica]